MAGKTILKMENPTTQRTDAVAALAAYLGRNISGDGVLDLGSLKLVKSNKGDAFYGVTANKCSCPAATYHHGPCKHQRKHFPAPQKSREELEAESDSILAAHNTGARRLARPPEDSSIRPTAPWPGGMNGPVEA